MVKGHVAKLRNGRVALLVNPNVGELSSQQNAFSAQGIQCVVARDLSTALLAITQHVIDLAVVSSRIHEEGDGWALSGVLRMVFPNAYIAVLTPETSVMTLQAAINNGLNQVYEVGTPVDELVAAVLNDPDSAHPSRAN